MRKESPGFSVILELLSELELLGEAERSGDDLLVDGLELGASLAELRVLDADGGRRLDAFEKRAGRLVLGGGSVLGHDLRHD